MRALRTARHLQRSLQALPTLEGRHRCFLLAPCCPCTPHTARGPCGFYVAARQSRVSHPSPQPPVPPPASTPIADSKHLSIPLPYAGGAAAEILGSCNATSTPPLTSDCSATCRQRRAVSSGTALREQQGAAPPEQPQPLPWPVGRRALHSGELRRRSQPQQQEAAEESEAVGAEAAITLSGMAVKLSGGDPFLLEVADAGEGPLAAYKEGRIKGWYRKVRGAVGRVGGTSMQARECAARAIIAQRVYN